MKRKTTRASQNRKVLRTLANHDIKLARIQTKQDAGKKLTREERVFLALNDELPPEKQAKILAEIAKAPKRGAQAQVNALSLASRMMGDLTDVKVDHEHTHTIDLDAIRGLGRGSRVSGAIEPLGAESYRVHDGGPGEADLGEAAGHRERGGDEPDRTDD